MFKRDGHMQQETMTIVLIACASKGVGKETYTRVKETYTCVKQTCICVETCTCVNETDVCVKANMYKETLKRNMYKET